MNSLKLSNKELIELQKTFRSGEIKENEIPKPHLDQLKELYYKQIELLENSIEDDRMKILKIKNEINM